MDSHLSSNHAGFRRRLIQWYARHARSLPWRGTTDPYRIWVSEIMLQQTTTKTVEGYFTRFITRFPDIEALADAELDRVNRLWEGLGYYRRCAQMHRAAREIVQRFNGVFPDRPEEIRALPGIGRYTAGAILSIAFDRRFPILEANTIRLHARLLGLRADPTQREANERLWTFAENILPRKNVGRFNQALMDLGSLVCTPQRPKCLVCPVVSHCEAARQGVQHLLPFPKTPAKKEDRTEIALLVRRRNKVLMIRYPENVRWGGMWDFPRADMKTDDLSAFDRDPALRLSFQSMTGLQLVPGKAIDSIKHVVTRFRITVYLCHGTVLGKAAKNLPTSPYETRWFPVSEMERIPLHSTARKFYTRNLKEKESDL